jgi:2,4-dienoyl-CoA reductase-like NADH-dependent reductase (Old Yellow Enzyme family)/thioredoxin reductase
MIMLPTLFSPLKIGKMEIKNRLAVSPMVTNYCEKDGTATERYIAYHVEKAKGGWGLILTENHAITPEARGFSHMAALYEDSQVAGHAELTRRVHAAGAKIVAQIVHAGRQTNHRMNTGVQVVAPSAIPCPDNQEIPHELSIPEVRAMIARFGDAALRAKQAGFDGVEIHGGHGYLVSEFMSSYTNKRVDQYGGILSNRLRFVKEIIEDIRAKVGADFPLFFRISSHEGMPGGRQLPDTCAIAMMLEQWGIDAIDITSGVYGDGTTVPSMAEMHAWNVDSAAAVKRVVSIPVMIVGRINEPIVAESVLKSGMADIIAMGRGSLADPHLPEKAQRGAFEQIRQCIGCMQGCLGNLGLDKAISCLVNPELGFEGELAAARPSRKKNVVVVGGGPAGLEAARAAAVRGHDVTLYETRSYLGGQFASAAYPPYKGELASYVSWIRNELALAGVKVQLSTAFTRDMANTLKPDSIIVAAGSVPLVLDIPGIKGKNVVAAQDVLMGKVEAGKSVAVLGGGLVGLETAVHLGWLGRKVTILEKIDRLAPDVVSGVLPALLQLLDRYGIQTVLNAEVTEVSPAGVTAKVKGEKRQYPCDMVVLALGMNAENGLVAELRGAAKEILVAGDAVRPRQALQATREGFEAGVKV